MLYQAIFILNPIWPVGEAKSPSPPYQVFVYIKYKYERDEKTWLFLILSLQKGSTLSNPKNLVLLEKNKFRRTGSEASPANEKL